MNDKQITKYVVICFRKRYPDVLSVVNFIEGFETQEEAGEYARGLNTEKVKENFIYMVYPVYFYQK